MWGSESNGQKQGWGVGSCPVPPQQPLSELCETEVGMQVENTQGMTLCVLNMYVKRTPSVAIKALVHVHMALNLATS